MRRQQEFEKPNLTNLSAPVTSGIEAFCLSILSSLSALESGCRQYHPPWLASINQGLLPYKIRLNESRQPFISLSLPSQLNELAEKLLSTSQLTIEAFDLFSAAEHKTNNMQAVMSGMFKMNQAFESLFPLRTALRPINRFFLEPGQRNQPDFYLNTDPLEQTGLFRHEREKGGSLSHWLLIPELYNEKRKWPLVVALHGGFSRGRDIFWFWVREARSRGFLLLAPNSRGRTWALESEDEIVSIKQMIQQNLGRWQVDESRILLTGFSDGATYTLKCAMGEDPLFSAFAPIAGMLPPVDLKKAQGRRIYQTHGALDWMFPMEKAERIHTTLSRHGASIKFNPLENLSHTYPREINPEILEWFEPGLAIS